MKTGTIVMKDCRLRMKNNVFCNKYDKDKYYKEKRESKWKG